MASSNASKLSREDFKRQKAIEEQRKAGTLPAEVDPETGQDINPHIPHYISQAPWYLDIGHPTLKHQRVGGEEGGQASLNQWYDRGKTAAQSFSTAATKFRKGACENCGAMTHKQRDCVERPRKQGAKWTGSAIKQDEVVQNFNLSFDAKRDRWNGYDPNQHSEIIKEYEMVEEERKKLREQEAKKKLETGDINKADSDGEEDEEDEFKYADGADAIGQRLDTKSRTTVRNLRIREDTAKYLLNLDVNSAYYDPKTRSMRDNPLKDKEAAGTSKDTSTLFAGDNFERYTGDATEMARLQLFAWDATAQSSNVHIQANPSQAELMYKQHLKKKTEFKDVQRDSILEKYGGGEHLKVPPRELLLAQTENYVEYSQTGRLIKGQERAAIKSKYQEDIYLLNHTSVWGSYWRDGKWGYICCHAFMKNAYCTGEAGIEAAESSAKMMQAKLEQGKVGGGGGGNAVVNGKDLAAAIIKSGKAVSAEISTKRRLGEGDVDLDKDKLQLAIEAERKKKKKLLVNGGSGEDGAEENGSDEGGFDRKKKSKYNSAADQGKSFEVTEEELEAYRMEKSRGDDPMANYKDDDDTGLD